MALRNIVKIDEEKCIGCEKCVHACAEGAIQMIDGKARLISEIYCDGLGACSTAPSNQRNMETPSPWGICTSVNNAELMKAAGYGYVEEGVQRFLARFFL